MQLKMKLQLVGILLCAFVLSSFGHDAWSRSHHGHKAKKAHHHDRQNSNTCWCPCECSSTTGDPVNPSPNPTSPNSSSTFSTETTSEPSAEPSSLTPTLSTSSPSDSSSTSSTDSPGPTSPSQNPTSLSTTTSPPTEPVLPNNTSTLQIYVNATINVVAVVNVTANVAFVLDINNNLTALFNGSSGVVIIFNYQENIGYYISGNSSVAWNASQENFQSFFAKLDLTIVYRYGASNGTRFTLRSVSVEISLEITYIIQAIGVSVSNSAGAASLWVQISLRWSVVLQGSLQGFLSVIGSGVTEFRGGIWRIIIIFEGLGKLLGRIQGGVAVLIQNRVRFEFSLIINARTSIQIFIYIVTVLRQSNVDVSGLTPNNSTNIFDLISIISGNSTVNTCGVITLVGRFIALAEGRVQISVFIQTLFDFYQRNNNSSVSIGGVRRCLISLRNAVRAWGWVQVAEQIDLLLNQKYVVNGVDIYALVVILIQQSPNPLQNIVQILVVFQKVVEIDTSIGELFLALVYVLRNDNGIAVISVLLRTEINVSGINGSLLSYILSNVSVGVLNQVARGGDLFYEFLKGLRIFGQIVIAIDDGLGSCSNLNLRGIFTYSQFRIYRFRIVAIFLTVKRLILPLPPFPPIPRPPFPIGPEGVDKHFDVHHRRAEAKSKHQHLQDKHGHHEDKHFLHHEQAGIKSGHGHLQDKHGHHEEKHVLHHLKHLEHDKHHPHARNQENEKLSPARGGH